MTQELHQKKNELFNFFIEKATDLSGFERINWAFQLMFRVETESDLELFVKMAPKRYAVEYEQITGIKINKKIDRDAIIANKINNN